MLGTTIGRLRLVGIVEGTSYLLLLGVAMPLKYMMGMPKAVSVVGMAHGVLFIAYCLALFLAMEKHNWSIMKGAGLFIAAVIPFGTYVADRKLKEEEASLQSAGQDETTEELAED